MIVKEEESEGSIFYEVVNSIFVSLRVTCLFIV